MPKKKQRNAYSQVAGQMANVAAAARGTSADAQSRAVSLHMS